MGNLVNSNLFLKNGFKTIPQAFYLSYISLHVTENTFLRHF